MYRLALAALLVAGPAMAQDGDLLAQCELADCPVNLAAGGTYMLKVSEGDGDGTGGYLIDPAGSTVLFVPYNTEEGSRDADARASYSATYTVRVDGSSLGYLYQDCLPDGRTLCAMSPAAPAVGASTSRFDVDAFRMRLEAGHVYTWAYGAPTGLRVALLDATGARLAGNHTGSLRWRARATGTYYLAVSGSVGAPYRVTMR